MRRHEQTAVIYCNLKVNKGIIAVEKRQWLSQPVGYLFRNTDPLWNYLMKTVSLQS